MSDISKLVKFEEETVELGNVRIVGTLTVWSDVYVSMELLHRGNVSPSGTVYNVKDIKDKAYRDILSHISRTVRGSVLDELMVTIRMVRELAYAQRNHEDYRACALLVEKLTEIVQRIEEGKI